MQVFDNVWHLWLKRPYRLSKSLDVGSGQELIILVHGLAASTASWANLVRILDKKVYRIVGYDLLGFGDSPKPKLNEYGVEDHAKALEKSIKKDFRRTPIILVSHSMGCIVTSRLAAKSKLKIKWNILYQPPILTEKPDSRRSLRSGLYSFISNSPNLVITYSRLAGHIAKKNSNFKVNEDAWEAFQKSLKNTVLSQETLNELINTRIKTDIIYGRFDFVVSRSQAKKITATNGNVVLHHVSEMHDISPRAGRYIKTLLKSYRVYSEAGDNRIYK